MKPPIIICDGMDISFFNSLEVAQISIEPTDVNNNLYTIYDSTGLLLHPVVIDDPIYDVVRIYTTDELRKNELFETLVEFYSEIGHEKKVLETMNLPQLIEIGKAYFK